VREQSFWNGVLPAQESEMINEHIKEHHIDLRLGVNLKEIKTDENGQVSSIIIEETGEEIHCNVVGLTAGVTPNIDFIKESTIATGRGVKVNRFLETNAESIYAIGDCAEQHDAIGQRRNIEAVWYTGRMMGESVAQTICDNKTEYKPGHWFNSAKFLDIEYQTYGWVFSERNQPENQAYFQWKYPKGSKCITIAYDKESHLFLGINTFGIRMRHEIFDRWLSEKKSIEFVLEYLADANFDPEFYKLHEAAIVAKFNTEFGTNISSRKKSWKRIFSKSS
jgi:NADPH-dependent 2,4-dienoyl-CoA reductase/sulfur reductase-like enzyme